MLVVLRDHRVLRRYTYLAGAIGFGLLLLPLFPVIGTSIYGSRIWIQLGPFSFQPGEIAKIALAIFFAGYLVQTRDALSVAGRKVLGLTLPRARDLGPILVAWLASLAVLIFERDLGSSLLFFGLFVAMLYVATERVSWIVIGLTLFCAGAYLAYLVFGHVQTRVLLWLDTVQPRGAAGVRPARQGPDGDGVRRHVRHRPGPRAPRPHLLRGVRLHRPELRRGDRADRPVRDADALRCCSSQRGLRTSLGTRDGFGKLLAAGLSFSVALQCFVVVGGVTRVIPLTGLTMPFLSSGGSSLLANWTLVAILLRISDHARRPLPEANAPSPVARGAHRGGEAAMNAPVRRLSLVVAVLFASLLVSTTLIQYVFAADLNARPDNRRTLLSTFARERGEILVGQTAVAKSVPVDDEYKYQRVYDEPRLYAHVTGSYSFFGASGGLEQAENALLSGSSDKLFYRRVSDLFTGRRAQGANLETTLDPKVQAAAADGLKGIKRRRGRARPEDRRHPRHGQQPDLRPQRPRQPRPDRWSSATPRRSTPTPTSRRSTARSTSSTRPGRSSRSSPPRRRCRPGEYTENSMLPGPAVLDLPDTSADLPNHDDRACGSTEEITMTEALAVSCNTAFAYLGLQIGADALQSQAAKFGFGDALTVPMRVTPSSVPAELNKPQLAQSSIGQYDVQVTPAADGDGRGRRRQPRRGHEALPRGVGHRLRPRRSSSRPTRRSSRRPSPPRSPRSSPG